MADSHELQAAREKVAELERKDELSKRKAKLEEELRAVSDELGSIGKPPAPAPMAPKP